MTEAVSKHKWHLFKHWRKCIENMVQNFDPVVTPNTHGVSIEMKANKGLPYAACEAFVSQKASKERQAAPKVGEWDLYDEQQASLIQASTHHLAIKQSLSLFSLAR